jgi:aryl-alcohol dehydrogenase-like predicted oxidoreductase
VRHIGVSNHAAWQIMKALAVSRSEGLERFRCTQSYYSLAGRELEREIVPLLRDQHLGLLVWSPLPVGFFPAVHARGHRRHGRRANFDFPPVDKDRAYAIVETMRRVATAHGASVPQVALAWLLAQDVTTSVIIGARKPEQLEDNLKSVDLVLSREDRTALDEVSRLRPEYPEWMVRCRRIAFQEEAASSASSAEWPRQPWAARRKVAGRPRQAVSRAG